MVLRVVCGTKSSMWFNEHMEKRAVQNHMNICMILHLLINVPLDGVDCCLIIHFFGNGYVKPCICKNFLETITPSGAINIVTLDF